MASAINGPPNSRSISTPKFVLGMVAIAVTRRVLQNQEACALILYGIASTPAPRIMVTSLTVMLIILHGWAMATVTPTPMRTTTLMFVVGMVVIAASTLVRREKSR